MPRIGATVSVTNATTNKDLSNNELSVEELCSIRDESKIQSLLCEKLDYLTSRQSSLQQKTFNDVFILAVVLRSIVAPSDQQSISSTEEKMTVINCAFDFVDSPYRITLQEAENNLANCGFEGTEIIISGKIYRLNNPAPSLFITQKRTPERSDAGQYSAKKIKTIQRVVRGYFRNQDVAPSMLIKRKIFQHMCDINKHQSHSPTAVMANKEDMNMHFPPDFLSAEDKEEFEKLNMKLCVERFPENLMCFLNFVYDKKIMTCFSLAVHVAIKIINDPDIPKSVRDQVHICYVGKDHAICCIGDTSAPDSIIVDPWAKYINFSTADGYRLYEISHTERNRGFMGTLEQYQRFLSVHPSFYGLQQTSTDISLEKKPDLQMWIRNFTLTP